MKIADILPPASSHERFREEIAFQQEVVGMILRGKTEEALASLARYFHVSTPNLKVTELRGRACYNPENETIYLSDEELRSNPYMILHEFCHHLAPECSEKLADQFANDFIVAYRNFPSKEEYLAEDIILDFFRERGVYRNDIVELVNILKQSDEMMLEVNKRLENAGIRLKVSQKSYSFKEG
jgi:hypothetical protein